MKYRAILLLPITLMILQSCCCCCDDAPIGSCCDNRPIAPRAFCDRKPISNPRPHLESIRYRSEPESLCDWQEESIYELEE